MKIPLSILALVSLASAQTAALKDGSNVDPSTWRTKLSVPSNIELSSALGLKVNTSDLSTAGGNNKIPMLESDGRLSLTDGTSPGIYIAGNGHSVLLIDEGGMAANFPGSDVNAIFYDSVSSRLNDAAGWESIDWTNRWLKASVTGNTTVDWEAGVLCDPASGGMIVDWGSDVDEVYIANSLRVEGDLSCSALTTAVPIPIVTGGTGANSASGARANLGVVGLTGNETVAGNKTFSGQTELTGQTATNGTSAMTRDLADARYGTQYNLFLTTDVTSISSASYTNGSETITLPAGRYEFEVNLFGLTASSTAGLEINVAMSGNNDTDTAGQLIKSPNISVNGSNVTPSTTIRTGNAVLQYLMTTHADASNKAACCYSKGMFSLSASTTFTPQVKQRSATDASNAARLLKNSSVRFIKR